MNLKNFLVTVGLLGVSQSAWAADPTSTYGIVFDAGSSSTRLYLYEVSSSSDGTSKVKELMSIKTDVSGASIPAVTQVLDQPQRPSSARLDWMEDKVIYKIYASAKAKATTSDLIKALQNATPYFYATAGVRSKSGAEQKEIMGYACHVLANIDNIGQYKPVKNCETQVRVISGQEEGAFEWITDNYLRGHLQADVLSPAGTTVVTEIGGSSVQNSFLPITQGHPSSHYFFQFKNSTYPLYAYSYSNTGLDAIVAKYTGTPGFESCFLKGTPGFESGLSSHQGCVSFLRQHILPDTNQPQWSQPVSITAVAAHYYWFNDTRDTNTEAKLVYNTTLKEINERGAEYCSLSWEEAKQKYSTFSDFFIKDCVAASLSTVLLENLHVTHETIQLTDKISGASVTWPLGAAYELFTHKQAAASHASGM